MSKGFRPKPRQHLVRFGDDTEYAGLEVLVTEPSVEAVLRLVDLVDKVQGDDPDVAAVGDLFARFARCLVSWNVEDEHGKPVAADLAGVEAQPFGLVMAVVQGWLEGMIAAPPNLSSASGNGGIPPEASLPMEALSASPLS